LKQLEQIFEHTPTFLRKCAILAPFMVLCDTYTLIQHVFPYSESMHTTYVKIGQSHQKL